MPPLKCRSTVLGWEPACLSWAGLFHRFPDGDLWVSGPGTEGLSLGSGEETGDR